MKKLLLAVAAVMLVASAGAQGQGHRKFWVGGTLGLSQVDDSDYRSPSVSSFTVLPEFGRRFNDRWAAGIRLGMSQIEIDDYSSMQTFSVAPFARYTFFNWRALSLFVDGGIDFSSADGRLSADGAKISDGSFLNCGLFVNPGLSVRVYKNIALVGRTDMNIFNAGYAEADMYSDGDIDTWAASINSGFTLKSVIDSFSLGFVVTF